MLLGAVDEPRRLNAAAAPRQRADECWEESGDAGGSAASSSRTAGRAAELCGALHVLPHIPLCTHHLHPSASTPHHAPRATLFTSPSTSRLPLLQPHRPATRLTPVPLCPRCCDQPALSPPRLQSHVSMTRLSQLLAGLWLVLLSCSCLPTHLLAQTYVSYQGFQPYSLTFDSAGHLWVLDGASFNILQMSGTGGELSRVDVSQLEPPMECPQSMRMDSGGNFFIVDSCNSLVYVGWSKQQPPHLPCALPHAADVSAGCVCCCCSVSPKGVLLNMLSTTDPELQYPTGLALDAQGNVYVGDQGNQRVVRGRTPLTLLSPSFRRL